MRSLTPLEAAVVVAVLGSVVAIAVPGFLRSLHASRMTEPIDGLGRIAARASALAASRSADHAYPDSVPLTPAIVPAGTRVADPPGTWDQPTWQALEFSCTVPHAYAFEFESRNAPGHAVFNALSHGDLDGDGALSTFQISGSKDDGAVPRIEPLEVNREIE